MAWMVGQPARMKVGGKEAAFDRDGTCYRWRGRPWLLLKLGLEAAAGMKWNGNRARKIKYLLGTK